jgi:2',3'-cyclic-nucleotide 2'-phosphodiesterase (5'-nucleotidase family)
MDDRWELDPLILSRTQPRLQRAAEVLAEPVGELRKTLSIRSEAGEPSEVEQLIAAAITEALAAREVKIEGVFHGLFDDRHAFKKGRKTIGDLWEILPYENYLVTAELTPLELKVIMEEVFQSRERRSLTGFEISVAGQGREKRLTSSRTADGRPLDPAKRYRIALNTFDARSAGHRFMKLRSILERPEARCTLHPVQTREALIEYFRRHKILPVWRDSEAA